LRKKPVENNRKAKAYHPLSFVTGAKVMRKMAFIITFLHLLSPVSAHSAETNQLSIRYVSMLMRKGRLDCHINFT